jgi:hypothetical protein
LRQRLGLAAAMLGRPPLLIIDEPANGLDPAGIREVRGLLRDLAAGGAIAESLTVEQPGWRTGSWRSLKSRRTHMLWLLKAEFRKLIRPLVWGTALAIVTFCLLIIWAATHNARAAMVSPRIPDICARAATAQCRQVVAHAHGATRAAAAATGQLAQPGELGHVAAGMLASLPGLLLIAMFAGGRWGGEWESRTIRQLLCREGRRGRVLTAKWLSIWAAGVATLLTCWLVLAAAAPSSPPRPACRRPTPHCGQP